MALDNERSYDGGGFVVTEFTTECAKPGCRNQVWHRIASHGGDMEDVDSPTAGWCQSCIAEEQARWRMQQNAALSHEAALLSDPDDLPFD